MSPTTSATRWTSTLFQFLEGNSAFGVQYEQLNIVFTVLSSILYNTASDSYWTINIKCDSWCDATLFGIGYTVFFMKLFVVAAFTIDYILRIYTADIIDPVKYGGFLGRLRFMITFLALVDFFSIVPFYIGVFVMPNAEMGASTFLRMLRLLRMAHAKQPNKIVTIPPVPSSLNERTQSHFIAGSTFRAAPALVDGFDRAQQHPHVREGGVARVRFQSRFIPEIYSTMLHATKTITRSENFSAGRTSSAPSRGIDGIAPLPNHTYYQEPNVGGTTLVPYRRTAQQENSWIILHAITAMPRYEQKSFEELRLEDYIAGNKGTNNIAPPPNHTYQEPNVGGTTLVQYRRTAQREGNNWIVLNAITAMPRYEQKSFEELRLEDYMAGNIERHLGITTVTAEAAANITSSSQSNDDSSQLGYQEPDVYCDYPADDETLRRISSDDPSVTGLYMGDSYWAEKAEQLGNALSKNIHLRKLHVCSRNIVMSSLTLNYLFQGLAFNRSIEHLTLECFDISKVIPILASFFELNHNFRSLELTRPTHFTPFSSLVLCRRNQLERIVLDGIGIRDGHAAALINAIQFNSGSRHFEMCWKVDHIGLKGCTALAKLLVDPHMKLRCLVLSANNLDDECIEILADALIKNSTVRELSLLNQELVTPKGWGSFSSTVSNRKCLLQKIVLSSNNIGEEGAISFGNSLAANVAVESSKRKGIDLDLSDSKTITLEGWGGFSSCLTPDSALVGLNISGCSIGNDEAIVVIYAALRCSALRSLRMNGMDAISANVWSQLFRMLKLTDSGVILDELELADNNIDDDGAAKLFGRLRNSPLGKLVMTGNDIITPEGWVTCFQLLVNSQTTVKSLDLSSNNIDDEGAVLLSGLLTRLSTAQLFLSNNIMVSANGWMSFADVLQSGSASKLNQLCIGSEDEAVINDAVIARFADVLTQNTCLESLEIYDDVMSSQGLITLANTLCDNSSIANICHSNHTLRKCSLNSGMPTGLVCSLLDMNSNDDKADVIRTKILLFYFSDIDNIGRVFARIPVETMPHAFSWIGRDGLGFTTMYQILRNFPLVSDACTP